MVRRFYITTPLSQPLLPWYWSVLDPNINKLEQKIEHVQIHGGQHGTLQRQCPTSSTTDGDNAGARESLYPTIQQSTQDSDRLRHSNDAPALSSCSFVSSPPSYTTELLAPTTPTSRSCNQHLDSGLRFCPDTVERSSMAAIARMSELPPVYTEQ